MISSKILTMVKSTLALFFLVNILSVFENIFESIFITNGLVIHQILEICSTALRKLALMRIKFKTEVL